MTAVRIRSEREQTGDGAVVGDQSCSDAMSSAARATAVRRLRSGGGSAGSGDPDGRMAPVKTLIVTAHPDPASLTADVAREQRRLDGATDVVLVFPVWWWSVPALLKGWIDRVFVNGWAFTVDPAGGLARRLGRLTVHLLPVAGDDVGVYDRHGYREALRTQLEHGVVDFCGARRGVTAFVHDSEQEDAAARERTVAAAVEAVRQGVVGGR